MSCLFEAGLAGLLRIFYRMQNPFVLPYLFLYTNNISIKDLNVIGKYLKKFPSAVIYRVNIKACEKFYRPI